jgi:hypothetical protein
MIVAKELCYDLEDFAWYADADEAEDFGVWALEVSASFSKFPTLSEQWEQYIKKLNDYMKIIESKR